ncbi:ribonuclease H family protein [Apilactobacillus ozensis]|uniref:ribonuclease H family protein n=1 Tax=Apilactobacillus ozensis TaxID=866801 RepID=UPI00200A02FF|nr:ribonuclease H family protein [Apilactobacillus ozensis]MCK8606775.1 ribonuclease H family protein [Apilactobacillus ozensis]
MASKKFYAVKSGRKTGVFTTWPETESQVKGFSGAIYKSFKTLGEAEDFIGKFGKKTINSVDKNKPVQSSTDYELTVYTDGGSRNNGNVAGQHVKSDDKAAWAYLILHGNHRYANSAGEFGATNNRMEIMALVNALAFLKSKKYNYSKIKCVLDSKYVLDAITKGWLNGWKKRGWKKSNGAEIKNLALFKQLDLLLSVFTNVNFVWTKGHANNEGNNFVDNLLNQTMDNMNINDSKNSIDSQNNIVENKDSASVESIKDNLRKIGLLK